MSTIRDRNMGWRRKRVFLGYPQFTGLSNAGAGGTVSLDTGGRAVTTRTGLLVQGLIYVAAADAVTTDWMIPYDVDITKRVGVRVIWTSNAAAVGARTITWQVLYGRFSPGAAFVAPATALDTVITVQPPTGINNAVERGNRGVINANTFVAANLWIGLRVVMSAFDAAFIENKYLLGLEIDYMPQKTLGSGNLNDTTVPTSPLGFQLS